MTMSLRIGLLGGTAILASACGGQSAAPAATSAPPPTTAPAKPAGAATAPPAAAAQAPAKPAAPAPAGWQTVKHPNAAECQVAAPGNWQAMPESAMAMLADRATVAVVPSKPAEADALKMSLKTQGGSFIVDTPTRWAAELATPAGTAYYIFWTTPTGDCFATLQTTALGVQELGATARQIAEAAGAGR